MAVTRRARQARHHREAAVPAVPIAVVDAFTDRPFAGNPAGVCVLDRPADPAWMQRLAAELRHSETAFCWPEPDHPADSHWGLRWFTPTAEVELCGHATLAAAHWLRERGAVTAGAPIAFATASGTLTATVDDGLGWLDFPARPVTRADAPPHLLAGLEPIAGSATAGAVTASATVRGRAGNGNWVVELADVAAVDGLAPDLATLATLGGVGVIVTAAAPAGAEADFVSRFFAPAVGVDEDPVTGSAHCTLAPLWAERLGRAELLGEQRSARGGHVRTRVDADRVHLGGHAVTVLAGELDPGATAVG